MKNISLKRELLDDGRLKEYLIRRKMLTSAGRYDLLDDNELYQMTEQEMKACEQMRKQKYACYKRIKQHIDYILMQYPHVYFMTFSFNDNSLNKKPETRRRYIQKMLFQNCHDYVCNIDYGDDNDREHYHGVIASKEPLQMITGVTDEGKRYVNYVSDWLIKYDELYGFHSAEEVRVSKKSRTKIARYVAKLSNHSVKVKQTKIMIKQKSAYQSIKTVNNLAFKKFDRDLNNDNRIVNKIADLFGIDPDDVIISTAR